MSSKPKMAFLVLVPDAEPDQHRCTLESGLVKMIVQMVPTMDKAVEVAKQMADEGVNPIELCGGFGNSMTGKIAEAVKGKAFVGAVRFDFHAAFAKSSDEIFGGQ